MEGTETSLTLNTDTEQILDTVVKLPAKPAEKLTSKSTEKLEGEEEEGSKALLTDKGSADDTKSETDVESELVEEINAITSNITPVQPIEEKFNPDDFPPSYKDNNKKEQKAIQYVKTVIKQYNFLYNMRQPLFLKPKNELGVQKLVCTTIKPSQLPYKDLLDWPDIAEFVAGYVNYDPLVPPNLLPKTLFAPQTVLTRLHGHCFEMSTLLCSMLIAAGYDAFVVSGYATREVTTQDLSYTRCPFVEEDKKVFLPTKQFKVCRYTPRAPRLFRSEYELRMTKMRNASDELVDDAVKAEKERKKMLEEAPPPDHLHGWRIHSWVVVLSGLRDVTETFFIEPSTGVPHPTDWAEYLGIESIWNHKNYYINVQFDKIQEGQIVQFDIGNSCNWEFLFPGQDMHPLPQQPGKEPQPPPTPTLPAQLAHLAHLARQNKSSFQKSLVSNTTVIQMEELCGQEMHLDLAFSWSLPLHIKRQDYDREYPTGKRIRRYKKAIVEDFCRYLNPDGLIRAVSVFYDLKCEFLWYVQEHYADREDMLHSKFFHKDTGMVVENFNLGRHDFVREHRYIAGKCEPDNWHLILYEPNKRVDELYKRVAHSTFLENHYKDRADKRRYIKYTFGERGSLEAAATPTERGIEEITVEYDRDPEKPADDDIATVTFSTWCDEISVQYHTTDNRFYGSTRDFMKPPNWWDSTQIIQWSPELHSNFELNQFAEPKSELQLYQMLISLMDSETSLRNKCRVVEKEMGKFLACRSKEQTKEDRLVRTFLQADEDEAIKCQRLKEKAQRRASALLKKSDVLKDYLEPFICSLGLEKVNNRKQAVRVKEDCMLGLKDRLVSQAGYIKERFEKERETMEKSQLWYHDNFHHMSSQDVQDFKHFMVKRMFTSHILEQRLAHLKTYALVLYQNMFDRLRTDPRLEPFLNDGK